MSGILKCDKINLNDPNVVLKLKNKLKGVIKESEFYQLHVSKKYYFRLDEEITDNPGWYVILESKNPLYVGKAENLNSRLNTENGSRDQFANPQRTSDPERNILKKFNDIGVFEALTVCPINEEKLCKKMLIEFPLSDLDRNNIEKFINIFRTSLFQS